MQIKFERTKCWTKHLDVFLKPTDKKQWTMICYEGWRRLTGINFEIGETKIIEVNEYVKPKFCTRKRCPIIPKTHSHGIDL